MALENPLFGEDSRILNGSVNSQDDESICGSMTLDSNGRESENPENVLLEDLESYWTDINGCVTISRMVSDSVIKGMVNTVEQEAAEKIAQKEMELTKLKETYTNACLTISRMVSDSVIKGMVNAVALENPPFGEDSRFVNGSVNSHDDESVCGSMTPDSNGRESENPENVLLENLESNWIDINGCLTISRMVSDSVIKGMVNAVEQEAAEKIAQKEMELTKLKKTYINACLTISRMVSDSVIKGMVNAVEQEPAEMITQKEMELTKLKETLRPYNVFADEKKLTGSLVKQHLPRSAEHGCYSSLAGASFDQGSIAETFCKLKTVAKDHMSNLNKEIDRMKGSCSIKRVGSGSEMVGLSGILEDKIPETKWIGVDKSLKSLETTVDCICKNVDDVVNSSKVSFHQWQQEKDFLGEIEDAVIKNCIRSLTEEFEQRLWDQDAQLYDHERVKWLERIGEISSLLQELDAISKALSVPDMGLMTYHGSMEIDEEGDNNKKTDNLHRKVSSNHVSLSTSLWEGNGIHDETVIKTSENLDFHQLEHMSREKLMNFCKTEMTKMKRNYEHQVQEKTEEFFSLRRQYLKERGSALPFKKDKEFDTLRKKILAAISKLDDILVQNEKLPALGKNGESLCSLEKRLESSLSENCQLKSLLADKKPEIKNLSSQVSNTPETVSRHALVEAGLVQKLGNLKCALENAHIEASMGEDVYKYVLRELEHSSESVIGESDLENELLREVYEVVIKEAAQNANNTRKLEFEDSDMEGIIMQGLSEVFFREAFKEAQQILSDLDRNYSNEHDIRLSVEMEVSQKEDALRLEVVEKERLKQEMVSLASLIEEKENFAKEVDAALANEKESLESLSQELNDLKAEKSQQQILISETRKESDILKGNLAKALEQLEQYKVEVQEKQIAISLFEAKEREHEKKMRSLITLVHGFLKAVGDFECRVMKDIKRSNLRLDKLSSQSRDLIQNAKTIKRTGLMYKQKLEGKCSDLQKAEAEVDLLGDQVDTLLNLLESIYIALDHYSPILHHYPGITDILKLVRREIERRIC